MCFRLVNSKLLLATVMVFVPLLEVKGQPANPANREYGRTTLIKTTDVTNTPNTSPVREYGSQALIKSGAKPTDADYRTYVDNLEKRVSAVQGPKKFLGQVIITFNVSKDGKIDNAKVTKSSNMPQIDTAALAAVQAAAPFSAMPKTRTKPIIVQVTFDGTSSNTTTHALVKNP